MNYGFKMTDSRVRDFCISGRMTMSTLTVVLIFFFFVIIQPYHLTFQEQYQMFLYTKEYFIQVVCAPGGFADYSSRFLTQFLICPWSGALTVALLFLILQMLVFSTFKRKDILCFALSSVPPLLMVIYFCWKDAMLTVFTAAIIGLLAAKPLEYVHKRFVTYILVLAVTSIVFFLCGNLGTVFFLAATFGQNRDFKVTLTGMIAVLACVCISSNIYPYPSNRLLFGIHYARYHDSVPALPWISSLTFWGLTIVSGKAEKKVCSTIIAYCVFAAIYVLTVIGLYSSREPQWEEIMKYSTLTCNSQWEKIIECAEKKSPSSPLSVQSLNLALAEKEQMGERMFSFHQMGQDGLFYPYRREHISPIPSSMTYWYLGMLNTSQRFTFAAQEVIPDYQKSAWCHKRLAQIYITEGNTTVARKYMEPLKHTLFHRKWALDFEKILNGTDIQPETDELERIRSRVMKDSNCMYAIQNMYRPLEMLCLENPDNMTAYQYLLGLCLLNQDIDRFADYFKPDLFESVPIAYQEAYVLLWSRDHDNPIGIPDFISKNVIDRFIKLNSDAAFGSQKLLEKKYSNTYWYYFMFYEDEQTD